MRAKKATPIKVAIIVLPIAGTRFQAVRAIKSSTEASASVL